MKKLVILIALVLLSGSSFAQKFTLNEMIKMISMNWDDFDTYVTSRGYTYDETEKDNTTISKTYSKKSVRTINAWSITKHIRFNYSESEPSVIMITYNTESSNEYLSLKSQAKTNGFSYKGTESYENGDEGLNFEKNSIELTFAPHKAKSIEGYERNYPRYEIAITKRYKR